MVRPLVTSDKLSLVDESPIRGEGTPLIDHGRLTK
jgi:hypothetical protein